MPDSSGVESGVRNRISLPLCALRIVNALQAFPAAQLSAFLGQDVQHAADLPTGPEQDAGPNEKDHGKRAAGVVKDRVGHSFFKVFACIASQSSGLTGGLSNALL